MQKIGKELPGKWIEKALFVVTATSFSGSFRHVHSLSHEIGNELVLPMSDITYRIFKDTDIDDIFGRMSCYFENQLIAKTEIECQNLQSLEENVRALIRSIESDSFKATLRDRLLSGPLGTNLVLILRRAARAYEWHGVSFTRNKFIVAEATNKIYEYAIKILASRIVETIINHLQNKVSSGKHDFYSVISKHINPKDFEDGLRANIILVILSIIFGPVGWIVSAVVILLSGTYIHSDSFREAVADKLFTKIQQNLSQILSDVVAKFCSDALPRYEQFKDYVSSSYIDIHRYLDDKQLLIRKNKIENEFRIVSRM